MTLGPGDVRWSSGCSVHSESPVTARKSSSPGGCVGNVLLGIVGALAGGAVATYLGFGGLLGFDWRGLVTAILTALLAILLGRLLRRPR